MPEKTSNSRPGGEVLGERTRVARNAFPRPSADRPISSRPAVSCWLDLIAAAFTKHGNAVFSFMFGVCFGFLLAGYNIAWIAIIVLEIAYVTIRAKDA